VIGHYLVAATVLTKFDLSTDLPSGAGGDQALAERVDALAAYFVDGGQVVPGLTLTDAGRGRSWWWPLPTAADRDLVRSIVLDPSSDGHRQAADALALAVDLRMRTRLNGTGLVAKKGGRRTVSEAWLQALTAADPHLPVTLDAAKVGAFADTVTGWVRAGAALQTRTRVVLRLSEPAADEDGWRVDVLVQDTDEPSLIVDAAQLWDVDSPFPRGAVAELLQGLGRVARLAPELSGLLDSARPSGIDLTTTAVIAFVQDRVAVLSDAGIGLNLPGWWSQRQRVRLRAKATSKRSSSGTAVSGGSSGFGFDQMVSFTWEAALGETKLTAGDLHDLERAAATKQSLVRVRGEWVELDPAELAAIIDAVGSTGQATAAELMRTALGLPGIGLPAHVGTADVTASGWLGELLDGALHATVAPITHPPGFTGQLRPYQQRGTGWLTFLGRLGLGACLADDMGLGKTAQLIATVLSDPIDGPTLVVCPVSVLGNWQRELERFAPTLRVKVHHGPDRLRTEEQIAAARADADVVLTTYSLVARDLALLQVVPWGRLVLDEAQQVKNPGTAQTKAIRQLSASRRIALTGTPVENRLGELWSLMHVLNPGLLGTQAEFKRRFATPIETDHDAAATALLRRITGPFVLRRLKTDRTIINDLPDKIELTEQCPLTREQATLYRAVVDDLLRKADESEGIERRGLVLAGIGKLKQVCNHPAHFARDGSALSGRSGKLNRVEELLDEIISAGDKVLLFTQFAEWGDLLVPYFTARYGRAPLWLHGGVTRKKRDAMVEQFQAADGPNLFLLSIKAGGTGLNLTAAGHVIHLDRWWNPAVEDQATDRAYRIGQKHTVLVHKLVSSGTIEERIDAMITSKRALAESVVGTGEGWITELSTEQLRDVIALRSTDIDEDGI
jgi:SNF2 family DNA or RNA helicase